MKKTVLLAALLMASSVLAKVTIEGPNINTPDKSPHSYEPWEDYFYPQCVPLASSGSACKGTSCDWSPCKGAYTVGGDTYRCYYHTMNIRMLINSFNADLSANQQVVVIPGPNNYLIRGGSRNVGDGDYVCLGDSGTLSLNPSGEWFLTGSNADTPPVSWTDKGNVKPPTATCSGTTFSMEDDRDWHTYSGPYVGGLGEGGTYDARFGVLCAVEDSALSSYGASSSLSDDNLGISFDTPGKVALSASADFKCNFDGGFYSERRWSCDYDDSSGVWGSECWSYISLVEVQNTQHTCEEMLSKRKDYTATGTDSSTQVVYVIPPEQDIVSVTATPSETELEPGESFSITVQITNNLEAVSGIDNTVTVSNIALSGQEASGVTCGSGLAGDVPIKPGVTFDIIYYCQVLPTSSGVLDLRFSFDYDPFHPCTGDASVSISIGAGEQGAVCGNDRVDGDEECDRATDTIAEGARKDCLGRCIPAGEVGECKCRGCNGIWESGEPNQCDGGFGCAADESCVDPGEPNECTCQKTTITCKGGGEPVWYQTDWSGGSGQRDWVKGSGDATKYLYSYGPIDVSPGSVSCQSSEGVAELVSSIYDSGKPTLWDRVEWDAYANYVLNSLYDSEKGEIMDLWVRIGDTKWENNEDDWVLIGHPYDGEEGVNKVGRYAQYKIRLRKDFAMAHNPDYKAPRVSEIRFCTAKSYCGDGLIQRPNSQLKGGGGFYLLGSGPNAWLPIGLQLDQGEEQCDKPNDGTGESSVCWKFIHGMFSLSDPDIVTCDMKTAAGEDGVLGTRDDDQGILKEGIPGDDLKCICRFPEGLYMVYPRPIDSFKEYSPIELFTFVVGDTRCPLGSQTRCDRVYYKLCKGDFTKEGILMKTGPCPDGGEPVIDLESVYFGPPAPVGYENRILVSNEKLKAGLKTGVYTWETWLGTDAGPDDEQKAKNDAWPFTVGGGCGNGIVDPDGVDDVPNTPDDEQCDAVDAGGNWDQAGANGQCTGTACIPPYAASGEPNPNGCTCGTYCGDGEVQKPNAAKAGGPWDNGYEQCDGTDGQQAQCDPAYTCDMDPTDGDYACICKDINNKFCGDRSTNTPDEECDSEDSDTIVEGATRDCPGRCIEPGRLDECKCKDCEYKGKFPSQPFISYETEDLFDVYFKDISTSECPPVLWRFEIESQSLGCEGANLNVDPNAGLPTASKAINEVLLAHDVKTKVANLYMLRRDDADSCVVTVNATAPDGTEINTTYYLIKIGPISDFCPTCNAIDVPLLLRGVYKDIGDDAETALDKIDEANERIVKLGDYCHPISGDRVCEVDSIPDGCLNVAEKYLDAASDFCTRTRCTDAENAYKYAQEAEIWANDGLRVFCLEAAGGDFDRCYY
jgi:hypothetical protein